ncbi:MAG: FliM/FliN family flagellar motor switch protein [Deltaproteobacteria bacterium]|jgi:flagellar motor switch/type III secretory pathway protein FliN|nr:FliM/FliN family flagellar motor switch protein [Deltaproteobacteria bacterium]
MKTTIPYAELTLPRVAADMAAILNRLYVGSRSFVFRFGNREWRFTPDASIRPRVWRARVYARLGDHDLALFMDSLLAVNWENSDLPLPLLLALPPELAGAALELACQSLAEDLEQVSGLPVVVSEINLDEEEAYIGSDAFLFTLTRDDGQTAHLALVAGKEAFLLVADMLAAVPSGRGLFQLPLRCRIVCSGPEVTLPELADLASGDVLCSSHNFSDLNEPGLTVRLALSSVCGAPARLVGTELYLEGSMTDVPTVMPDNSAGDEKNVLERTVDNAGTLSPAPGNDTASSSMDMLPVRVDFDLGSVELTVAEVSSLAAGQVLQAGRDVATPVRISIAGRVMGTGSLVDVAGHIGVRVETLSLK